MPGVTLQVEREIKTPFNVFVQRESVANLNFVNPETDNNPRSRALSKMDLRGMLDPNTDRKVSGDRVITKFPNKDFLKRDIDNSIKELEFQRLWNHHGRPRSLEDHSSEKIQCFIGKCGSEFCFIDNCEY